MTCYRLADPAAELASGFLVVAPEHALAQRAGLEVPGAAVEGEVGQGRLLMHGQRDRAEAADGGSQDINWLSPMVG